LKTTETKFANQFRQKLKKVKFKHERSQKWGNYTEDEWKKGERLGARNPGSSRVEQRIAERIGRKLGFRKPEKKKQTEEIRELIEREKERGKRKT